MFLWLIFVSVIMLFFDNSVLHDTNHWFVTAQGCWTYSKTFFAKVYLCVLEEEAHGWLLHKCFFHLIKTGTEGTNLWKKKI